MKSKSLRSFVMLTAILLAVAALPTVANSTADPAAANPQSAIRNPQSIIPHSAFGIAPMQSMAPVEDSDQPPYLAQVGEEQPVDVYGFKRKSPTRAFLQSFLIPGWGQLYAKSSFWKPIAALGIEAATWAGNVSFRGKGHDLEDDYRAYADIHWDSSSYIDGLYEVFYSHDQPPSVKDAWLDTTTYLVIDEDNNAIPFSFSHHAWYKEDGSRVERDEFYENIGKYNQFNFGWDDFLDTDSVYFERVSPNRNKYLHMRDDANTELNKANTMLVATVANHLLWGFWAAIDARAFNRAQDQFGRIETNLQLVKSPADPQKYMPYFTMRYKF